MNAIIKNPQSVLPFADKIYAGIVGKLIGVYLGRAVEGWSYDQIRKTFGEINYFVNDKVNWPLIVPDDDISGTFLFYRFLYGTARATSDDPNLAVIPAMVPNRTNGLARSARWIGLIGLALSIAGLVFVFAVPTASTTPLLGEMGASLGVVAIGLGVGCAFSPTDERPAALTSLGLGVVAYALGAAVLLAL